jgi:hypothetical protein
MVLAMDLSAKMVKNCAVHAAAPNLHATQSLLFFPAPSKIHLASKLADPFAAKAAGAVG